MPTLFLSLTQKPSNYWKGQAFSSAKSRPWKWHFILRYVPQKHLTGQVISQRGIPQSYGVANVAEWFSNDFLQMAKAREGAAMNIFRIIRFKNARDIPKFPPDPPCHRCWR
jgi:hypothetical protein